MNEIAPLLEKLAQQLGTTTEYLWKVLIKQAPIDGIVSIGQYVLLVIAAIYWWKLAMWAKTKAHEKDYNGETYYILPGITGAALTALIVLAFLGLPNTVAAFLNPEYWAFQKVLEVVGQ
jgi:hypothetical protein